MNYPLISEYIEAIKSAEDNFKKLSYLSPVLGDDGLPVMTSGNFAVVFKMKDEETGKCYALKCFTKEQQGRTEAYKQIAEELKDVDSPYLVSIRYFDKELFVDTKQTEEKEFPVLLMDWVEGKPMDKYLRENLDNKYALEMLAYRFSQLAQWLIPQPFAHGDLKPDNILVREDGTLVLVDYDGMYVPAMKGQKARELGSPDFRHPLRTEKDFDEHIDDFPFVSILLSLKAISINAHWLEEYGAQDGFLMSAKDYMGLKECCFLKEQAPFDNATLNRIYALFLFSFTNSINTSLCILLLSKIENEEYPIITNEEEINNSWKDEKGVRYSLDRKRLLKGPINDWIKGDYYIQPETKVICNSSLSDCWGFEKVVLPQGLIKIGDYAFYTCRSLKSIVIPSSVSDIGKWAFYHCGLTSLSIPNSVKTIGECAFAGCEGLKDLNLSNGVLRLEKGAFSGCYELEEVVVSNSVKFIGKNAFSYCKRLKVIYLPYRIKEFGEDPFIGCENLMSIVVPERTKWWYENLLPNHIDKLVVSGSVNSKLSTTLSSNDWDNCKKDADGACYSSDRKRLLGFGSFDYDEKFYHIKEGTLVICDLAFNNYENDNHFLEDVYIPPSVESIGENPFAGCLGLNIHCDSIFFNVHDSILYSKDYSCLISSTNSTNSSIVLHPKVRTVGAYALSYCKAKRIKMPSLVKSIKEFAFSFSDVELLIISGVLYIDKGAFSNCEYLTDVYLNGYENTYIEQSAFDGCVNLQHVFVPSGCVDSFKKKLPSIANIIYGIGFDEYYAGLTEIENAKEIFELGKTYWVGKGIKKDLNEAVRLYELASELGDEDAKKELDYWGQYWFDEDKALYSKDRTTFHGVLHGFEYEIKEGTKFIADAACSDMGWECDCSYFSKLTIPNSIIGIGDNPFGCQMREVICLSPFFEVENDTLYSKGKKELIQCFNHETDEYIIPEGVEIIRSYAFYACNFRKVTIPSSVLTIGENPFIETGVFEDHHTVLEVLSNSALYSVINDALYERNRLIAYWGESELFELPDGIEEIGNKAFWGARVIRIILPTSLKTVAEDSFYWTERLKEIVVPANRIERFKQILPQYIHRDIVEDLNIDEMPF